MNECQCRTSPAYTLGPDDTPEAAPGDGWPEGTQVYGPCDAVTKNRFAPGHDAKLKGLLIKLYRAGTEYHYLDGGLLISTDPMNHAQQYGWGHFLEASKQAAERKPPKVKASKNRVAIPRKVPRERLSPVPPKGTVKIGRWVYPCVVDVEASDNEALVVIYTKKDGTQTTATCPPHHFTSE